MILKVKKLKKKHLRGDDDIEMGIPAMLGLGGIKLPFGMGY